MNRKSLPLCPFILVQKQHWQIRISHHTKQAYGSKIITILSISPGCKVNNVYVQFDHVTEAISFTLCEDRLMTTFIGVGRKNTQKAILNFWLP